MALPTASYRSLGVMICACVLCVGAQVYAGVSSCCAAQGTPGCDDDACQDTVCAIDKFCCAVAWDGICAGEAAELCPELCAGVPDCCQTQGTPGCNDPECEALICRIDPFCCETVWDAFCAEDAGDYCPACGGVEPTPEGACCYVDGSCADILEQECAETQGVFQGIISECSFPGTCNNAFPCVGSGDCCVPNGSPGCGEADCCELICGLDTFCCSSDWDQVCADFAQLNCQDLCGEIDACCAGALIPEDEPCGVSLNGGCNLDPPAFIAAQCGQAYCGVAWADGGTRDTDWYLVSLPTGGTINATLSSQFFGFVNILDGIATCDVKVVSEAGLSVLCTPSTATASDLPPGDYVVFVAPATFEGVPCGTFNEYTLTIDCVPAGTEGACCFFGVSCAISAELDCLNNGGEFFGVGTECFDGICKGVPEPCAGDLNNDGVTDSADLNLLLANFGCGTAAGGENCEGDLDNDKDTDSADLNLLLADFACGSEG